MPESKIRILLVDDHPKLLNFMRLGLKLKGFEVITAISGQSALEAVKSNGSDIMLLDIRLPDIDGFQVLQELRKFSRLPVIAYSATPEYSEQALKSGADLFIAKPFDMDQLIEKIRRLANHQQ